MINKVIFIGNIGKDPECRVLDNGTDVAKFSLATNESYKDKSGEWQTVTEWHNVISWRGLAGYVQKNIKKGKLVYVEGKLTHRKYQDKDGNDRYVTEVVANLIRLMEKKDSSSQNFPAEEPQQREKARVAEPSLDNTSAPASDEDEFPF